MKRFFALFAAILLLLVFALPAMGEETANEPLLWVNGTAVTAENAGDIFGDGSASYDTITQTLTLSSCTITTPAPGDSGIYAPTDLTIRLSGEVNIHGDFSTAILGEGKIVLSGGSLVVDLPEGVGISAGSSLLLKDTALSITAGTGLTAPSVEGENLSYTFNGNTAIQAGSAEFYGANLALSGQAVLALTGSLTLDNSQAALTGHLSAQDFSLIKTDLTYTPDETQPVIALTGNWTITASSFTLSAPEAQGPLVKINGNMTVNGSTLDISSGADSLLVLGKATFTNSDAQIIGPLNACSILAVQGLTLAGCDMATLSVKEGELTLANGETYTGSYPANRQGEAIGAIRISQTTPAPTGIACQQSHVSFYLNGEPVDLFAYHINGQNYVGLRDLAKLLQGTANGFSLEYNPYAKAVYTERGGRYSLDETPFTPAANGQAQACKWVLFADDELCQVSAYTVNDANYYALADLAEIYGFQVIYEENSGTVLICTTDAEPLYSIEEIAQANDPDTLLNQNPITTTVQYVPGEDTPGLTVYMGSQSEDGLSLLRYEKDDSTLWLGDGQGCLLLADGRTALLGLLPGQYAEEEEALKNTLSCHILPTEKLTAAWSKDGVSTVVSQTSAYRYLYRLDAQTLLCQSYTAYGRVSGSQWKELYTWKSTVGEKVSVPDWALATLHPEGETRTVTLSFPANAAYESKTFTLPDNSLFAFILPDGYSPYQDAEHTLPYTGVEADENGNYPDQVIYLAK